MFRHKYRVVQLAGEAIEYSDPPPLKRVKTLQNKCPGYDTKLHLMELCVMWSTPPLP